MLAFDLWNPTARCRGCFDGGFDRIESESQKKKKRLRGNERGAKEAAVAIAVAVAVVVDGRSELGVPVSRLTPAFFKSNSRR